MSIAPCVAMPLPVPPASRSKTSSSQRKCGHTEVHRDHPAEEAVGKIRDAVDARPSRDFLIVACTDARYSEGLDSAMWRAERFLEAGADILFAESPEGFEELRRVAKTFCGAFMLANMVEGGRIPYLPVDELGNMGFKVALYPGTGFLSAARALQLAYGHLRTAGIGTGSDAPMLPFVEMDALMGFSVVHAFERRYGIPQGRPE